MIRICVHQIEEFTSSFYINVLMLGIIMKLDVSTRMTPQVSIIICHHTKKVLLEQRKKRKKGNISKYGETRLTLIYKEI